MDKNDQCDGYGSDPIGVVNSLLSLRFIRLNLCWLLEGVDVSTTFGHEWVFLILLFLIITWHFKLSEGLFVPFTFYLIIIIYLLIILLLIRNNWQ